MIRRLVLRRFKRFEEEIFTMDGHVVLAGPNNSGKTTVLQAVAAFSLALYRWKMLNNFHRRGGGYQWLPITRQTFASVPLRTFDLLWTGRRYRRTDFIEIEVTLANGKKLGLEFRPDSTEQIYARPQNDQTPEQVRDFDFDATFIPPLSGLETDEPVYTRAKQEDLLGKRKPGDILRNMLITAYESEDGWNSLQNSMRKLFGCELLPPNGEGAHILAEYRNVGADVAYDVANAGSGFLQVLMLLTFLFTRRGSVLLLDEPDAHLHVILQDSIYGELRGVAARWNSQLIVATHSEVVINSVAPEELCMLLDQPRRLSTTAERGQLINALKVLPQTDIVLACEAPGILYLEGHTDLSNLREWAKTLNHRCSDFLTVTTFWRETSWQTREGAAGIPAQQHFKALQLVRPDISGLILMDGDGHPDMQATPITGQGLQRTKWKRYETESYLVHPAALERYVGSKLGAAEQAEGVAAVREFFHGQFGEELTDRFYATPLQPVPLVEKYLETTKARTQIVGAVLEAAGIHGLPYTRFHEIAALMSAEEIHPEVVEKLDHIAQALRL